jgi:predicted transcriptional regulator
MLKTLIQKESDMTEHNLILLEVVGEVVAAYVHKNEMKPEELPALIDLVHSKFRSLGSQRSFLLDRPDPAVAIEDSITDDFIICLEDGKQLKMLKRHLKTSYNMTPEQYRERWGLSPDYPMVAPNYAKQRSQLAKDIGLGTRERRRSAQAA